MRERVEKIQSLLNNKEAALITSNTNRRYLTDFNSSAGAVLITRNSSQLLIDFRYFEKAKKQVDSMPVTLAAKLYDQINELLKKEEINTLYIETDIISIDGCKKIKSFLNDIVVSDSNIISKNLKEQRSVKNSNELSNIKEAQRLTDEGFSYILNRIKEGITEKEIALDLEFFMRKNGCEAAAFDFISVSGKNSSLPHGVPGCKPLEKGDFLTLDFGGIINGYCSDMTRTVALGEVNDQQKQIYDIVLKAQMEAIKNIKSGVVCKDIDKIARDIISSYGYGECFGHGLGHSVGLEIHEEPAFNTRDTTVLKKGTVITVEPGIYIENNFGVRIEDMVYVTEEGCINLTNSTKELIIV